MYVRVFERELERGWVGGEGEGEKEREREEERGRERKDDITSLMASCSDSSESFNC